MESCIMYDINYREVACDLRLPLMNVTNKKLAVKSCDNGWIYDRTHYWDSAVMHVIKAIYHNCIFRLIVFLETMIKFFHFLM